MKKRVNLKPLLLILLFLLILANNLQSVDYRDVLRVQQFAVRFNVDIDSINSKINLSWLSDSNEIYFRLYKKNLDSNNWGNPIAVLDSRITSWTDTNVKSGTGYEYYVERVFWAISDTNKSKFSGYGFVYSGWNMPEVDYRGRILILIDSTIYDSLKSEINLFVTDITSDGWLVNFRIVPRTEQFNPKAVQKIKNIIAEENNSGDDTLTALILLGRIAVPYSGELAPDGHFDHFGAWPADVYYGNFDSSWTDTDVFDTTSVGTRTRNVPGDGKFDQSVIPSNVTIQIGRIDFYYLDYYSETEIELYRLYLNKNHKYRHGNIKVLNRAIIDDNFGMYSLEAFAANGWSNFSALFSSKNTIAGKMLQIPDDSIAAFSYGCGSGAYTQASGVANSIEFTTHNTNTLFASLFGSYLIDWDSQDNFLRAALASHPTILGTMSSGRPFWEFQHLGLGNTIGFSTITSQNASWYLYPSTTSEGYRGVHNALMGDPTIRLYMFQSLNNIQSEIINNNNGYAIRLNWSASNYKILGYNLYRTSDYSKKFEKINTEIIKDTFYVDNNYLIGTNIYMVRAVRLEQTECGSFYNQNTGIITEAPYIYPIIHEYSQIKKDIFIYPNPASGKVTISFITKKAVNAEIQIYDDNGKDVKNINLGKIDNGTYEYIWDLKDVNNKRVLSGLYLIKIKIDDKELYDKVQVIF